MYKLSISASEFVKRANDRKFARILQLSRYVNQFGFIVSAIPRSEPTIEGQPFDVRNLLNGMLFAGSLLHEALNEIPAFEMDFGDYESFKNGFKKLLKSPECATLRKQFLKDLRNKVAYHIDVKKISETLEWVDYPGEEHLFVVGSDAGAYFPLADNVVFTSIMGPHQNNEAEMETIERFLALLLLVIKSFIDCTRRLIEEYIEKNPFS